MEREEMGGEPEQFEPETPGDLNALDGGDEDKIVFEDDGLDAGDDEAEESDK